MTTMQQQGRRSTDSTVQLLSAQHGNRRASYSPSVSSVSSTASTLKVPNHVQRGFRTREAYLAALQELSDRHTYMQSGSHGLSGFYGTVTVNEYKQRQSLREERRERKARAKSAKDIQRRQTVAVDDTSLARPNVPSADDAKPDGNVNTDQSNEGRFRRLSRVLSSGWRGGQAG